MRARVAKYPPRTTSHTASLRTPVNKAFSDAAVFGRCHHAECERWLVNQKRGQKEASAYVARRKQADRAELARSTQRPRPEPVVAASSRGLHRRTSRCIRPPGQDQEYGVPPALRDGPPRHSLRGAARPRRGRSRPHPLDWERYPRRAPCYRHGRDHPPDPAKYDGLGRAAHRGEGWQDRTRVDLLGSALALSPVGHHRPTRTLLVS